MTDILIKNGTIVTLGLENQVLNGHSLLIEEDKISKIRPDSDFTGSYQQIIDAGGKVVMPGFINAHMHFYSSLARGLYKIQPSTNFVEVLNNLWWKLDKLLTLEGCYVSAMLPLIDAVSRGTTTIIDHHASPGAVRGSLNIIAKAVKEVGIRASLCYEVSDRDGEKVAQDGIQENVDFLRRCQTENDPYLRGLFGLHAAFTLSDKTLQAVREAAQGLDTGFHIHTAEALSDQEYSLKNYGIRVVERLDKFGLLGPKSITAHCVHIDQSEMELIQKSGSAVVHNPQSNTNNAVGIADIIGMTEKGLCVGLGTDAMTVNMMEEVRAALWLHHLEKNNPSKGFCESLNTLLVNNAVIANKYWDIGLGQLKEGNAADIILIDYFSPTPFDSNSFMGHLAFGLSQSFVNTTICGGKVLMKDRQLKIDIDQPRLAARATELATEIWENF